MGRYSESSNNEFLENILRVIIDEGRWIPKFQVERAISPFIGLYLEDVLSVLLGNKIKILAAEFPLKKEGSNQSTNADWLGYDTMQDKFLLIELKTEDSSFRGSQNKMYKNISERGMAWNKIICETKQIAEKSKHKYKYDCLVRRLEEAEILPVESERDKEIPVDVIYLAPILIPKIDGIKCYTFSQVLGSLMDDHLTRGNLELISIFKKLASLESGDVCESSAGGALEGASDGKNYRGVLTLDGVLDKVKSHSIQVGFTGGVGALRKSSWDYLSGRPYKWDFKGAGLGKKDPRNWIGGEEFVEAVSEARPSNDQERVLDEIIKDVESRVEAVSGDRFGPWLVSELARRFDVREPLGE